jgi:hypothetical protein
MVALLIRFARAGRGALLLLALLSAAAPAAAQLVTGKVVEEGSEQPIGGAMIDLLDASGARRAGAVADSVGVFSVMVPQPGSYRLRVTHIAYTATETAALDVSFGVQVRLELRMSPTAVSLEPLRVVGRSSFDAGWLQEFYDRAVTTRRSGIGRVFFRDEVDREGVPVASGFLTYLMPRGGCRPTLFLDGLQMEDARHLNSVIQPDLIEGVELYNNQAFLPDRYANRGFCAVALFWTRRDLEGTRPLSWRRVFVAGGIVAGILLLFQL